MTCAFTHAKQIADGEWADRFSRLFVAYVLVVRKQEAGSRELL
jgi:hypothetical protein